MTRPLRDRIAGTKRNKAERGNVIEQPLDAKIKSTVKFALAKHFREKGFSVALAAPIEVESQNSNKKGDLLGRKQKYQNNSYTAEGWATYFLTPHAGGPPREKVRKQFSIKFGDALDSNGMPDIKINEFAVT